MSEELPSVRLLLPVLAARPGRALPLVLVRLPDPVLPALPVYRRGQEFQQHLRKTDHLASIHLRSRLDDRGATSFDGLVLSR